MSLSIPAFAVALLASSPLVTPPETGGAAPVVLTTAALPGAVDAEAARLIPDDATIVFRIESLAATLELFREMAALAGEEFDGEGMQEFLSNDLDMPGDLGKVARDRPLYMAMSVSMAGPVPTFVLPTSDAAALSASVLATEGPRGVAWSAAAAGGYVGASQKEGYAAGSEASAILSELAPGTISIRVDLASLIQSFRPLIEMGLEQAELQMDQLAEMEDMPFDMTPLLEAYLDFTWDVVDSADRFDMGFGVADGALDATMGFRVLEGSPLASFGGEQSFDLSAFPGAILPDSSIAMVVACDWLELMDKMGPMIEGVLDIYPEPLRASMKEYMTRTSDVYGLMGPVMATSGDFGANGMRVVYYLSSDKPGELMAGLANAMQAFSNPELGVVLGAPTQAEIAGTSVVSYAIEIDYDKLVESMAELDVDAEAATVMSELMGTLYGEEGVRLSMAHSGNTVAVVLGGNEAYLASVIGNLDGSGRGASGSLARGLASASGGSFGLVYKIDFGTMIGQMASMFEAFGLEDADMQDMPTSPLPIAVWGAMKGRVWSGGASTQLDSLEAFMAEARALQEARAKRWEEEIEAKLEEVPDEEFEEDDKR